MSKVAIVSKNTKIAKVLRDMIDGKAQPSRFIAIQLMEKGYVEVEKAQSEAVKLAGRGRHKMTYVVSSKGRGLANLSKNWKTAA
jgi:hypothetical protein